MQRLETIALPVPPEVRARLLSAGYRILADFHGVGPVELAKDACISHEEALQVLKLIPHLGKDESHCTGVASVAGAKSAWELLTYEKSRKKIILLAEEFDRMLGGGFSPREVTEICGVPGIGKTQIGMQLCLNAQIPAAFGGLEGSAVYIDTEGSFMVERMVEMAEAWRKHLQAVAQASGQAQLVQVAEAIEVERVLSEVHFFRVYDVTEQAALLNTLGTFLEHHPRVRLLVIDSMTFHFRHDFDDMGKRTRLLNSLAQKLMALAEARDIAVVLVNQVTTKVIGENNSKLVPALGESWSHACTNRVILFWMDGERCAHLYKSPSLKAATVNFSVTAEGVRSAGGRGKKRAHADEDSEKLR